jgi:hypothetical protein
MPAYPSQFNQVLQRMHMHTGMSNQCVLSAYFDQNVDDFEAHVLAFQQSCVPAVKFPASMAEQVLCASGSVGIGWPVSGM